jgi:hypothetical protein
MFKELIATIDFGVPTNAHFAKIKKYIMYANLVELNVGQAIKLLIGVRYNI